MTALPMPNAAVIVQIDVDELVDKHDQAFRHRDAHPHEKTKQTRQGHVLHQVTNPHLLRFSPVQLH